MSKLNDVLGLKGAVDSVDSPEGELPGAKRLPRLREAVEARVVAFVDDYEPPEGITPLAVGRDQLQRMRATADSQRSRPQRLRQ